VEGGEKHYPMKSMISTLFSYSKPTMENQLFSAGFVKDEAGKADDATNKGYVARRAWTNSGASKSFYGKLFVDLFQQSRYLVGNVEMKIKLIKASNAYALWTNINGERPKVVFEAARLYLRKIRPHPLIMDNLATNLSRGGVVHYPITRNEIITIPTAAGLLNITKEQLFYGRVPKLIIMAMVDNEASGGVYGKNPFDFKHCNVKEVELRIDGEARPVLALKPDFKGKNCIREYNSLLESMGILGKDASLPFTYDEFLAGYTFFSWNLTPDYQGQVQDSSRRRDIRLDVKFAEPTTTTMNILLYAIFDATIMIDASGNVMTDFKD
jgi:hypothetical protein